MHRIASGRWKLAALAATVTLGVRGVPVHAVGRSGASSHASDRPEIRELNGEFQNKPSLVPTRTIPVDDLGFAAPGPLFLGERNSLVSLDFIGENQLLFTFRVPALLRRTPGDDSDDEREIRAVVLSLPQGTLAAESHWLVHDRSRYLWVLHDGHFLLRDEDKLYEGDNTLKLKPLLRFPGPLLSLQMNPAQNFLVTNSREPSARPQSQPSLESGDGATIGAAASDLVLRILERSSEKVLFVARVPSPTQLPINSQGYLSSVQGSGVDWEVMLNFFTGGQRDLGAVKSNCMPQMNFISEREFLATACSDSGDNALVAMNTRGEQLWVDLVPDRFVWPNLLMSPDGSKIVRETLYVSHSIAPMSPMGDDDIKGQWVQVLDAASGKVIFETPATPILDAGGNVAISPSGRQIAVLSDHAIQIFELPAAPSVPSTRISH